MKTLTVKIIIAAISLLSLASCGKSYMVHNTATNSLEIIDGSDVGNDFKVGDTIRSQNTHRLTSIGNAFETTKFTGVVISVDNN